MRNTMQRLMVTCLAMALFVGCGSAAPAEETPAVTGVSGGPSAPVASSTAGRTGGAAGGGAVPGLMMSSVACGTATCSGIMFMGTGAAACCADAATNACGTMQGGACMPKPPVAELCPKIAPIFGMQINSCCQANNTCGVDGSALGRGCGPYSGLRMIPGAMVPPETMCDGTPIAPAAGAAGTGAAGTAAAAGSSAAGSGAAGTAAAAGAGARAGTGGSATGAAGSSAGAAGARAGAGGSATSGGTAGARAGAGGAAGR